MKKKMHKISKQILTIFMVLCMVLTALPVTAEAAGTASWTRKYTFSPSSASSQTWTAAHSGWYMFYVIGSGGNGGNGGSSVHGILSYDYPGGSGGSGGAGGLAVHMVYLRKGETATLSKTSSAFTVVVRGTTITANNGAAGSAGANATRPSTLANHTANGGAGGAGGTASGGNVANYTGTKGAAGGKSTGYITSSGNGYGGSTADGYPAYAVGAVGAAKTISTSYGSTLLDVAISTSSYGASGAGGKGGGTTYSGVATAGANGAAGKNGAVLIGYKTLDDQMASDHDQYHLLFDENYTDDDSVRAVLYGGNTENLADNIQIRTAGTSYALNRDYTSYLSTQSSHVCTLSASGVTPPKSAYDTFYIKSFTTGTSVSLHPSLSGQSNFLKVNNGDYVYVSFWYRATEPFADGTITLGKLLKDGKTATPVSTTLLHQESTTLKSDSQWHEYWAIFKVNESYANASFDAFFTIQANSNYVTPMWINGINVQIISGNATAYENMLWNTTVYYAEGQRDVAYFKNASNTFYPTQYTQELTDDGWYTWYVRYTNTATSQTYEHVYTIEVSGLSSLPPLPPSITINPASGWSNIAMGGTTVTLAPSTEDKDPEKTQLEYSVDNKVTWVEYTEPFKAITSGTVYARGSNENGVGETSSVEVLVDLTLPTFSHNLTPDTYTNGSVDISITASDADSGYSQMRFNKISWSDIGDNENTYTVNQNGTYPLEIRDVAGNILETEIVIDKIDKTAPEPPTIQVKQGGDKIITSGGWASGTVTVSFLPPETRPLSGISHYLYSLDEGVTWTEISVSGSFSLSDVQRYSIKAKTVSVAGVESERTELFTFTMDTIDPTITIQKNIEDGIWTGNVPLKIIANDNVNGSGVKAVYYYRDDGSGIYTRIEIPVPYLFNATANGSYTFEVEDAAGNVASDYINITQVDDQPPAISAGIPRLVELSADKSYATIHLVAYDVGSSGFAYYTLPGGGQLMTNVCDFRVGENGVFPFAATDFAGNSSTFNVTVTGLKVSDDATATISLTHESTTIAERLNKPDEIEVILPTDGIVSWDYVIECNSDAAEIISVNSTPVNATTFNGNVSVPADETLTHTIVIRAAAGNEETYTVLFNCKNVAPQIVAISNKPLIERTRWSESGYVRDREFVPYDTGKEGIIIEVETVDKNIGQYITGEVTYDGLDYAIHWGSVSSGVIEYKTSGKMLKGFAFIPVSSFYDMDAEDRNNTYAYVKLYDAAETGGEAITTSSVANSSVRIQTDVTAPDITTRVYTTQYALKISVADTLPLKNIKVTLSPDGGAGEEREYKQSDLNSLIMLEEGKSYSVTVKATDLAEHSTEKTVRINYMSSVNGTPEEGALSGGGQIPVVSEETEGGVYYYKSRAAQYYIIGGKSNNTDATNHTSNFLALFGAQGELAS